jgi:hypothetical protein
MSEQPDQPEGMSLAELMGADPLSLTKEDRRPIIEYYRERRNVFITGGKPAKEPKTPKQSSKGPLPEINLDLGDLDV